MKGSAAARDHRHGGLLGDRAVGYCADGMSSRSPRTTVDSLLRAVARTATVDPWSGIGSGPPRVFADQFELRGELGRGGMGVVYLAHDRRLDRAVAIKVMHPERWAHVPRAELTALFEREARATARLNHPSIVTLHQTGEHDGALYLVLELLRGANLGAVVRRPMVIADAIAVMIQIADAIAYAHDHGVLHRDLKPHNVFVGDAGRIWVLDFGLASLAEVGAEPDATDAPRSRGGTPGYMAPEQRAGGAQDARTDVWALGLLLYQLVTAYEPPLLATAEALDGDDWQADLARLPPPIAALVRDAVAWDPAARLPTARAFADRLRELGPIDEVALAPPPPRRRWGRWIAGAGAVAALTIGGFVIARSPRGTASRPVAALPPIEFTIDVPEQPGAAPPDTQGLAVSPDGTTLAFLGRPTGGVAGATQIYLRRLDRDVATPIEGTNDAECVAFSPDGDWLAYTRNAQVWKRAIGGGAAIALASVGAGTRGVTWLRDGRLVVAPNWSSGLSLVPAEGGALVPLTHLASGEKSHRFPHALPDGRTVLFVVGDARLRTFDDATIEAVDVTTGARRVLTKGGAPRYVPPSTLLVPRDGQLLAIPFDPVAVALTGPPQVVLDDVLTAPASGAGGFDIGADTLAHIVGDPHEFLAGVARVDARGEITSVPGPELAATSVRASRDGRWLLVRADSANPTLWSYELERGIATPLTHTWDYDHAVMTADHRTAYVVVTRGDAITIERLVLDGTAASTPLYQGRNPANLELSSDGTRLIFEERDTDGLADLMWLDLAAVGPPARFRATVEHETQPALSPDGRWLAYVASDSGRNQVYLQAFPTPGFRVQVSTDGGEWPRWRADGGALVFRRGDALWSATITVAGAEANAAAPTRWLTLPAAVDPARRTYDLLGDGVVMVAEPPASAAKIRVIHGWRPPTTK